MSDRQEKSAPFSLQAACSIYVVVPDDGTDLELMTKLLEDKGITRADSVPTRAVSALREARTKRGKLPEPALARLVTIIVAASDADAVFDFVYEAAKIDRPGGGLINMARLLGATSFKLPETVPAEGIKLD
jgi:hypothetical protein